MMAGIRGKNTLPELQIRKGLFANGFRYRIHVKDLPGKPDLVFPRLRAIIFVNGCFWHGHKCHLFRLPKTRREFWASKIRRNRLNDTRAIKNLRENGWRVMTVWECSFRGRNASDLDAVISRTANWLCTGRRSITEIRG